MLQENPLLERADGDDDARPAELPLAGPARAGEAEATRATATATTRPPSDDRRGAEPTIAPSRPSVPIRRLFGRRIRLGRRRQRRATTTTTTSIRSRSRRQHAARPPDRPARAAQPAAARPADRRRADRRARRGRLPHADSLEEIAELFPERARDRARRDLRSRCSHLQSFEPAGVGARDAGRMPGAAAAGAARDPRRIAPRR